ncbi:MAG TPA: hypothetical protein EYN66_16360 [Myxococcales bacterium]|nr:hypothetical protein [Myxococcales bacterium]
MRWNCTAVAFFVVVAGILISGTAFSAEEKASKYRVAVTVSPIHLVLPMGELTAEIALPHDLSVAVILGFGQVTVKSTNILTKAENNQQFTVIEAGAQLRYCVLGDFDHGMQVGAEFLYLQVDGEVGSVTGGANGLSIGPFVGYKIAWDFGLTLDIQAGASFLAVDASASDGNVSASTESSAIAPLVNLNLGWSF